MIPKGCVAETYSSTCLFLNLGTLHLIIGKISPHKQFNTQFVLLYHGSRNFAGGYHAENRNISFQMKDAYKEAFLYTLFLIIFIAYIFVHIL